MTTIRTQIKINATKEQAWQAISDLGGVMNFHPFVPKSYYVTDEHKGIGAARICELDGGIVVREEATHWVEGEELTLDIEFLEGMAPPIKSFFGTLRVEEDGEGVIVSLVGEYETKMGIVGAVMDKLMIRKQYEMMLPAVLQGLKHNLETGETVDGDVLKRINVTAVPAAA